MNETVLMDSESMIRLLTTHETRPSPTPSRYSRNWSAEAFSFGSWQRVLSRIFLVNRRVLRFSKRGEDLTQAFKIFLPESTGRTGRICRHSPPRRKDLSPKRMVGSRYISQRTDYVCNTEAITHPDIFLNDQVQCT